MCKFHSRPGLGVDGDGLRVEPGHHLAHWHGQMAPKTIVLSQCLTLHCCVKNFPEAQAITLEIFITLNCPSFSDVWQLEDRDSAVAPQDHRMKTIKTGYNNNNSSP